MRTIEVSTQFKRDLKKATKQGKNLTLLEKNVKLLQLNKPLSEKYRPHQLSGNWKGYSECHLAPDWLLIFKQTEDNRLMLALRLP